MERRDTVPYVASRAWEDQDETPLLRDVAFNRHSMNDGHHVSPFDNGTMQIGDDGINVALVQGLNPEFQAVLSKCQRATIGIDLRNHDEENRDWEEMLKGGLQTALESQVVVFEVSGVSRACTHQLVRSRRAAFHQQSMRASFYGNQPETRIPESIWRLGDDVRKAWVEAMMATHKAYQMACEADASYQDARYILPEGTNNYIVLEYPLREFMAVYAYRGCSMFQWEIVSVMRLARELLVRAYPWLDPYVKISCEKTKGALDEPASIQETFGDRSEQERYAHHCTFQGWESVEGQCPFAWARESNRSFRSEHHRIERKEPVA
jgi:flavin-dependent thymidylate synthase